MHAGRTAWGTRCAQAAAGWSAACKKAGTGKRGCLTTASDGEASSQRVTPGALSDARPDTVQASTARRKRELRPSDARRIAAKMGRSTEALLLVLNAVNLVATVLVGLSLPRVVLSPVLTDSHLCSGTWGEQVSCCAMLRAARSRLVTVHSNTACTFTDMTAAVGEAQPAPVCSA